MLLTEEDRAREAALSGAAFVRQRAPAPDPDSRWASGAPARQIRLVHPKLAEAFVASPALESGIARLQHRARWPSPPGQQPGLFTGPCIRFTKRSPGRRWRGCSSASGRGPCAGVLLAGDDHDYAEASQASWIGADGTW